MKQILILVMVCISTNLLSQTELVENKTSITAGILQGGGSLLGADLEFLITKQFGFQLGAGFVGYGAGLNYHLKPSIRSSFISLQYWHQGVNQSFAQSLIGPNFVYRSKKWFTCQIGLAAALEKGPAMADDYVQPPVMLMYSIGAYFPF